MGPAKKKPQSGSRKQQYAQQRRLEFIAIAERIFQEHGFTAGKAEDIAAQAGISVGTIYNIFGSKEQLYAQVLEGIGGELVHKLENINKKYGPATALEKVIALRLSHYRRWGLFLTTFALGYVHRDNPAAGNMFDRPRELYYQYLDHIAKIIACGIEQGLFAPVNPFAAAIGFEGILNAFVSYWLDPHCPKPSEKGLHEIKNTVMAVLQLRRPAADAAGDDLPPPKREVFITKYDYLRLKELLEVAQMFDSGPNERAFTLLTQALGRSKIVNSEDVPGDVVTMNSKLCLCCSATGERRFVRLVFPADVSHIEHALSILTPLGTVLLGQWNGATVTCEQDGREQQYIIDDILYQPESAGDFHL